MRAEAFLTHGNLRITVVAEPSIFPATQTDLMLAGVDSKGPFLQEKLTPDPSKARPRSASKRHGFRPAEFS